MYLEQVRITGHGHDKLKLESLKPLQAIIKWPTAESPPLALVDFNMADHVSLRGFTIAGPFTFPACSPDRHEGVLVENAFDENIEHNHITMIANSVAALRGCQEGDAVSIGDRINTCDGTAPGSADLKDNLIDEYQKNGVQVFNSGSSADIDHNEIVGPAGTGRSPTPPRTGGRPLRGGCGDRAQPDQRQPLYRFVPPCHERRSDRRRRPSGLKRGRPQPIVNNEDGVDLDSQNNLKIEHNDVLQSVTDGIVLCGDTRSGLRPGHRHRRPEQRRREQRRQRDRAVQCRLEPAQVEPCRRQRHRAVRHDGRHPPRLQLRRQPDPGQPSGRQRDARLSRRLHGDRDRLHGELLDGQPRQHREQARNSARVTSLDATRAGPAGPALCLLGDEKRPRSGAVAEEAHTGFEQPCKSALFSVLRYHRGMHRASARGGYRSSFMILKW